MLLSDPTRTIAPTLDGPVLSVLAATARPMSGRRVAALAGASHSAVIAVLDRLVGVGVVEADRHTGITLYAGNLDHIAWPAVLALSRLRSALLDRLTEHLAGWPDPPVAAIAVGAVATVSASAPASASAVASPSPSAPASDVAAPSLYAPASPYAPAPASASATPSPYAPASASAPDSDPAVASATWPSPSPPSPSPQPPSPPSPSPTSDEATLGSRRGRARPEDAVETLELVLVVPDRSGPAWDASVAAVPGLVRRWTGNRCVLHLLDRPQLDRLTWEGDARLATWRRDGIPVGRSLDDALAPTSCSTMTGEMSDLTDRRSGATSDRSGQGTDRTGA